jgi:hypothetical protein
MNKLMFALVMFMFAALACGLPLETQRAPAPSPSVESPTPIATEEGVAWPTGGSACMLTTLGPTTFYTRPNIEAAVFFEDTGGFEVQVIGRTADGWVGFDPAIAQAANMGPFRLRWVFYQDVVLRGDCLGVDEVWAPLPGYCYDMPMGAVSVYAEPTTAAFVVTMLDVNDFAAITGLFGDDWAQIDLAPGNTGLTGSGWVEASTLNMNGAACGGLPVVTP